MTFDTVKIDQGKKRPKGWIWMQQIQVRRGILTIVEPYISAVVPPGTSIKLCGLSSLSPFRWRRMHGRTRSVRQAATALLSVAWEDSDRVVGIVQSRKIVTNEGVVTRRGLHLRAYAYRSGVGATSPQESREIMEGRTGPLQRSLGFVPNGTPGVIWIDPQRRATHYETLTETGQSSVHIKSIRRPTRLMLRNGVHANGVDGKQDVAPAPITLRLLSL